MRVEPCSKMRNNCLNHWVVRNSCFASSPLLLLLFLMLLVYFTFVLFVGICLSDMDFIFLGAIVTWDG